MNKQIGYIDSHTKNRLVVALGEGGWRDGWSKAVQDVQTSI